MAALGAAATAAPPPDGTGKDLAVVLHIDGAIGPASADYLARSLDTARERRAAVVVLRMNTPGGLDTSMREMIRDILASPVPVLGYVSPSGGRAASAGTYILYASHVAAMAPGTNLGAATPVAIGGPPPAGDGGRGDGRKPRDKPDEGGDAGEPRAPSSPTEAKAVNDAVAYIRSLAELRGRNAEWAERAVREAASLPASEALAQNVIDLVADGIDDLLAQAHGRTVRLDGREAVLQTRDLAVEHLEPNWRTKLLAAITNPNVALILMMVGIYGLIFEFMNPGALYPGTIGAISLLVGLYALAALPLNYAGFGLIALGLALMVAEAFAPSFGILGIGGAIALALGAAILIDTDLPGLTLDWRVAFGIAVVSLAFTLLVVRMAFVARRQRVRSGRDEMVGALGTVQDWAGRAGHVFVHSERWRAVSAHALAAGQPVRVVAIDGLILTVEPYQA